MREKASRCKKDSYIRSWLGRPTSGKCCCCCGRVAEPITPRARFPLVPHALPRAAGARCCARPRLARPPGVPQGSLSAPGRPAGPHLCPALSIARRDADTETLDLPSVPRPPRRTLPRPIWPPSHTHVRPAVPPGLCPASVHPPVVRRPLPARHVDRRRRVHPRCGQPIGDLARAIPRGLDAFSRAYSCMSGIPSRKRAQPQ